jgi:Family of unknown function (DUF6376)
MKKLLTTIGLAGMLFLSGCSILGEVNNTVEYANITTDYIESTKTFASEVPQLAKDAVTDEIARKNLEDELESMKEKINSFNEVEPPSIAEDIHNQILTSNEKLEEGIDLYLVNIENGTLDPSVLENSEIMTTVNEISSLMENINQVLN